MYDDTLIFSSNDVLNKQMTIVFIDDLLSNLEIKVHQSTSHGCWTFDNIAFPGDAIIANDLKYGRERWWYRDLEGLVKALCFRILSFEVSGKISSNPYLGCKTIDELLVKKDLYEC